jgi:hypothetical protein
MRLIILLLLSFDLGRPCPAPKQSSLATGTMTSYLPAESATVRPVILALHGGGGEP